MLNHRLTVFHTELIVTVVVLPGYWEDVREQQRRQRDLVLHCFSLCIVADYFLLLMLLMMQAVVAADLLIVADLTTAAAYWNNAGRQRMKT